MIIVRCYLQYLHHKNNTDEKGNYSGANVPGAFGLQR